MESVFNWTSRIVSPQHGATMLMLTVSLATLDRHPDGQTPLRLQIAPAITAIDGKGARFRLRGGFEAEHRHLHKHPFYFFRDDEGRIVDVMHHEEDNLAELRTKRSLAASHQFVVRPNSRTWAATESDSIGDADARYTVRPSLGRAHRVIHKRLEYRPSTAVPLGFACTVNATAHVHPKAGPTLIRQRHLFRPMVSSNRRILPPFLG